MTADNAEESLLRDKTVDQQVGVIEVTPDDHVTQPRRNTMLVALAVLGLVAVAGLVMFQGMPGKDGVLSKTASHELVNLVSLPTLFCYMVIVPMTEEVNMAKGMARDNVGVFECASTALFSTMDIGIGGFPVQVISTTQKMGSSVDHTAANSNVFIEVWRVIGMKGLHLAHPWTVKTDPDAVFVPSRLQRFLMNPPPNPYPPLYPTDARLGAFVTNCDMYPGRHEDWPMMWGAVETISREAFQAYFQNEQRCQQSINWVTLGEDTFMLKCLRLLAVPEIFLKFQDRKCGVTTGVTDYVQYAWPNCDNPNQYIFHPHKDYADWHRCYIQTTTAVR